LITAIQNTPNSIGAFSLAYAISHQLPVNHLSLNGIEPTQKNVKQGKYQMVRHISIISKKTPKDSVKQFMNFAFSKQGAELLHKSGFVPFTQN
jgi:phosphate transport system substrate-binding protein